MNTEDKRRICARAFYQDNRDQYEDYHEALAEFMSNQNASDNFVEFAVEAFVKPEEGCVLVTNDEGHVASVRLSDGFFCPRTEMTKDDGEELYDKFQETAVRYPDLDGVDLLEKMGWKRI